MNTINDNDLYEPLNNNITEVVNRETKDVLAAFSTSVARNRIVEETVKVRRAQQIKGIRKSDGYMKFINKFKR